MVEKKPTKVGEFVVDKFLGQGSFGKVYKGKSKKGEEVAIKCMDMKLFKDPFLIESLKNEIHVMKKLTSKNVVQMYDVIQEPKITYIILEYCNEGDLGKYIRKNGGHLNEKVAIDILSQLMNGFQNLVQMGYIHRDIKPANCLIKNGIHKVADFGFATKVDITGRHLLKECVGTPLYMAPQLLENKPYNAKSDIWSIGMLFYEMLFGKTPWPCRDLYSFLRNIKTMPLRFPYDKAIGTQTKDFIKKCLVIEEAGRIGWEENEIFQHPLIAKQEEVQPMEIPQFQLDEKSKKIFRKMQEIIQTHNLDINQIFTNFDKDHGGDLSEKEFYKMMLVIDPRITHYEAVYLFKKVDKSGDGKVSMDEFKQVFIDYDFVDINDKASHIIIDLKEIIKANNLNLKQIFSNFDKDYGGTLDSKEFAKLLRVVAPALKDYEIQDVFSAFDANKDGKVDFEEFKQILAYGIRGQDQTYDLNKEKSKKLIKELKRIIIKFKLDSSQIFKNFDKSGDGKLDLHEFNKLCKVIDKNLPLDDVKSIFKQFDIEGNGDITFTEFVTVINDNSDQSPEKVEQPQQEQKLQDIKKK